MAPSTLPTTRSLPTTSKASSFQTGTYLIAWIISSNFTILVNKWLIDTAGFAILLTCWHLVFASVVTQVLSRTTSLLDSRRQLPVNGRFFIRTILPIGLVSSASLVCTNFVYFYLSVAFLQMVKASTPMVVLLVSWIFGVANPTWGHIANVLVIVAGVTMASVGEIQFSWVGFIFQMIGIVFEAVRVVLLQVLVSGEGLNMDPLVGLYYYAPVCAGLNFVVAFVLEVPSFSFQHMTQSVWLMLFASSAVALLLNLTLMSLIKQTSAVVMSLAAILKNILLVICSVVIWQTTISTIQLVGYGISLTALAYYSLGYRGVKEACSSTASWVSALFKSSSDEKHRISSGVKTGFCVALACLMIVGTFVRCREDFGELGFSWFWSA
ncbi:DUF250 domain membrane protein [Dactylonectria estremocensis]|uniref:DUF250 domain membrane protein n=1 Tax=Dactylonectria estremocensis TaxID=1079267 RepID=A0A9P9IZN9_9HYPO|nr:DUF250 domain membrane protein [Dactylonectria estremocensis]